MSGKSSASAGEESHRGSGRTHELVLDALYDRKRDKKTVRVLTVVVYVFCVSLAAIMLSLYYVFFWEPKDAHHARPKVSHTLEPPLTTLPTCFMPHTGRSNTTINESSSTVANTTVHPINATSTAKTTEISADDADAFFNSSNFFEDSASNSTTPQGDVT